MHSLSAEDRSLIRAVYKPGSEIMKSHFRNAPVKLAVHNSRLLVSWPEGHFIFQSNCDINILGKLCTLLRWKALCKTLIFTEFPV